MKKRFVFSEFPTDVCDIHVEEDTERVEIVFPSEEVKYAFYGREFLYTDEPCDISCQYGFMYPASAITFVNRNSGITVFVDTEFKEIHLKKKENVELSFSFDKEKGEVRIVNHGNDWHEGMELYKNLYANRTNKKANSLKDCYHVKRYFFNEELCPKSIINREGEVRLDEILKEDKDAFGGIDAGLLFDASYQKNNKIRCGNESPIGFSDKVTNAVKKQMDESEIPYFSYFDPYLIDEGSDWDRKFKNKSEIHTAQGEVFRNWGNVGWHPCLADEDYKALAEEYLKSSENILPTQGIYLDEFGNGTQYHCYNRFHAHNIPYNQNRYEKAFVEKMQAGNPGKVWMCEFPPADSMNYLYDLVLSDSRTLVNIYRFIYPQLKFVRIIGCDRPLGDNEWEVNKSFFNGEGLWLDNDAQNPVWYPERMKDIISRQYFILKKYSDIFESGNNIPLFSVSADGIMSNKFMNKNECILMFINPTEKRGRAVVPANINAPCLLYGKNPLVQEGDDIMVELDGFEVVAVYGME